MALFDMKSTTLSYDDIGLNCFRKKKNCSMFKCLNIFFFGCMHWILLLSQFKKNVQQVFDFMNA